MSSRSRNAAVELHRSQILVSSRCLAFVLATFAVVLLLATPSYAGFKVLGSSGWGVTWDASLDPFVDIVVDGENAQQVFIEKTAEFTQGPGPGGIFPTIPITFHQLVPTTVTQIVINDEIITNSTGVDWTDFHFELADGGDAAFDQVLTDASSGGAGFFTSPFDNQMWGGQVGPGFYTEFWVDGFGLGPGGSNAVVSSTFPNNVWFPGDGAFDGELFIDVIPGTGQPGDPFTVFTLKETPTFVIPEPTAAGLLVLGMIGWAAGGAVRRRQL